MNNDKIIGRVIATEKCPTTIDKFVFWTKSDLILNPFDVVKIEHVNGSFSYGVIEDISHITDASSFLTNYISNDFGDVNCVENTLRVGMNCVSAKVACNDKNIYIPLQNNAKVMFANNDEINYALGLNNIKNPLVCGYLEMYSNNRETGKVMLPVRLNTKFLIGPEGAHLNISGISGLASKTSYAMFLMKSIQDLAINNPSDDGVAFVMFNVKGKDLLAIDEYNDCADDADPKSAQEKLFEQYKLLGLNPEPFKNVHYYYPFSRYNSNNWNTYLSESDVKEKFELKKAKFYKYIYEDDKESLDLLFSNVDDTTQTMDSIITQIISGTGDFGNINSWSDFLDVVKSKTISSVDKEIPVVSWRKFYRIINKSIKGNPMFANGLKDDNETRIEESLKYIKKNEVHVIDIAKLSEDKQAYVFGDAMRAIYNLQLGQYNEDPDVNPPSRIIIFIDELNKYASKDSPKNSPILKQVLDIAERGRSLGVVLFAAEQFRSAIHDRVTGNCSTHAYGRTNSIETTKGDYSSIPSVYKTMMTRLNQGEYIIQNPVFRSLLSIKFPKPIYKQFK